MRLPTGRTQSALRFSLGAGNTDAEKSTDVCRVLPALVDKLRSLTRLPAAGAGARNVNRQSPMRIVVAMSGGVDSSVAAALLADAGHDVVGLSMQLYDQREGMPHSFGRCCTLDDLHDARRVAADDRHPSLRPEPRAPVPGHRHRQLRDRVRRRPNADSLQRTATAT